MVRYTLKQCAYFRKVAELGGIAQAARALNISQPSVSQAIEKLETLTGLVLFDRHHARGLELTLSGRMFLSHVSQLLDEAEQVAREAKALAAEASGEIRLGIFWTLSPFFMAGLIRSFATEAPGITLRHKEGSLVEIAEDLRNGLIEFAITYDRGAPLHGLDSRELAVLRPSVVLAADHPLAQAKGVHMAMLQDLPYVMLEGAGSREYFEDLLQETGLSPEIAYRSTSLESVRSAVAAGFGFTLLVMRPPNDISYDGRPLRVLPILDAVTPQRIVLAAREGAAKGPILRRFADHAGRYFTGLNLGKRPEG